MREIGWGAACFIGLAQVVGTVPGISRLGITLLAALLCGMLWEDAAVYSLLISVPIILGDALTEVRSETGVAFSLPADLSGWFLAIALLATGLIGFAAARLVLGRLARKSLAGFAVWCWGIGVIAVVVIAVVG